MILVTGATGFIGRSLMACLAREGIEARPYQGYLDTPLKLREALDGIDIVIHLAGAEARGSDRRLRQVDIEGTEVLLNECQRAGVQHLLFTSRLGANTASMHTLLRTKGIVERQIKQSGIPYTILRSATLYGRDDRFTEIILSLALWSWPFVWLPGGGETAMQPLWVEDLVRCLLIILKNRERYANKTIPVAGEERLRYKTLVRHILAIKGKKRTPVPLPMTMLRPSSRLLLQWWYWPPVTQYFVDRFFAPEVTTTDTILRHFGFRPAQLTSQLVYLRRDGMRRRLFRR